MVPFGSEHLDALSELYAQRDYDSLIGLALQILDAGSKNPGLQNLLGLSYARKGDFRLAVKAFAAVIDIDPDFVDAHFNVALAQRHLGNLEAAVQSYGRAIVADPSRAETHHNLALLHFDLGENEKAIECFRDATQNDPNFAGAWKGLGRALALVSQPDPAIAAYVRAIELDPSDAIGFRELGMILKSEGEWSQAVACLQRAIVLRPNDAVACNALANVLRVQGKTDQAILMYNRVLAIEPLQIDALVNLATQLKEKGEENEAIACLETALFHAPNDFAAELLRHDYAMGVADWSGIGDVASIASRSLDHPTIVPPFPLLAIEDNPAHQLHRSKRWASSKFPQPSNLPAFARKVRTKRIRVGYFSADVRNHPVMHLISGLFRNHDRSKFEISLYSYGPPGEDELSTQIAQSVEAFYDVRGQSDRTIIAHAQQSDLDIAVDLNGFTAHSRTGLFAHRLAPIQMNYLGYPGTSGTTFIDYIVADPVVIPKAKFAHYSENVIHLPHSYQANDNLRPIATTDTRRTDFGIPEGAFVFCSFNATYKITPREFDIWMRCLEQVENSVLWLLSKSVQTAANLRSEARKRGIEPERLIFAKHLPSEQHLARHKHADLFLDTFNVNAHTTASDALWAGLPVLTRIGDQFCARVAASLLSAVGLPELITSTDAAYEAKAVELALASKKIAIIRATLFDRCQFSPLFDTTNHCKALERAYDIAHRRFLSGDGAVHFSV